MDFQEGRRSRSHWAKWNFKTVGTWCLWLRSPRGYTGRVFKINGRTTFQVQANRFTSCLWRPFKRQNHARPFLRSCIRNSTAAIAPRNIQKAPAAIFTMYVLKLWFELMTPLAMNRRRDWIRVRGWSLRCEKQKPYEGWLGVSEVYFEVSTPWELWLATLNLYMSSQWCCKGDLHRQVAGNSTLVRSLALSSRTDPSLPAPRGRDCLSRSSIP